MESGADSNQGCRRRLKLGLGQQLVVLGLGLPSVDPFVGRLRRAVGAAERQHRLLKGRKAERPKGRGRDGQGAFMGGSAGTLVNV